MPKPKPGGPAQAIGSFFDFLHRHHTEAGSSPRLRLNFDASLSHSANPSASVGITSKDHLSVCQIAGPTSRCSCLCDVHAALAYYYDNQQEIADELRKAEEWAECVKTNIPSKIPAERRQKRGG